MLNSASTSIRPAGRFARAAERYDALARHQAHAAVRLMELLPAVDAPRHVLELGCGTGLLTRQLVQRYPSAQLTVVDLAEAMLERCAQRVLRPHDQAVLADASRYWPEEGPAVDAVLSSCALQWFADPLGWMRRTQARLHPGAWIALALPVEGTLRELAACAPATATFLPLPPAGEWRSRFESVGWSSLCLTSETLTLRYASALEVLRSLHGIGATCTTPGLPPLTPGAMRRWVAACESQFGGPDGVPCTYELLYVIARR